ncbi:hypothetical protein BSKO_11989 [Bryopsis sp. KO-2023]|nr:hypothetical protein BSKO_11989 [Bryopsis sp. KO-2023]
MSQQQVLSFVIVGQDDVPLFHVDLSGRSQEVATKEVYRHHFVLHAALDSVDEAMWNTKELHLKTVDRFSNQYVSAFVTPSNIRFLLLHDGRGDDSVRAFFMDVYESYLKVALNPFHTPGTKILSKEFNRKIQYSSKKYLG